MSITPEATERNEFIDQVVGETCETLTDPEVQARMNGHSQYFIDKLQNAIVANVHNGVVEVPRDRQGELGALVMVAAHRNEILTLSEDFSDQTPMQLTRTLETFRSWDAKGDVTSTYLDVVIDSMRGAQRPTVTLGPRARALTSTSANVFTAEAATQVFTKPLNGIVAVQRRPLVVLGMDGKTPLRDSEVVHELSHVNDADEEPILNIRSQHSANMWSLRSELRASAFGAALASVRLRRIPGMTTEDIIQDSALLQIAVEYFRNEYAERFGYAHEDPYKPTGGLLKFLQENELGNILHMAQDYEALRNMALNYEASRLNFMN